MEDRVGVLFVDAAAVAGLERRLGDASVTLLRAATEAEARELTQRYPTSVVLVEGADGLPGGATTGDEVVAPDGAEGASWDDPMTRFIELLPDAFCVAGPDGRFLRVNGAFERMLGWSAEELLSLQFAELVHPEDVAATARKMGQLLTSSAGATADLGTSFTDFENRLRVRDGGWRRVVWTSRYFPDEGVVYAIARDVTAERATMERLHHSEAVMAEAQAIGRFGSWELELASTGLDTSRSALRWSDETFRIFGYEPGAIEVSLEAFFAQVHPDDRDLVRAATAASLEAGERYAIDHRIVLPDGGIRHVHEAARPSRDRESGRPRLVGTVHDITARKEAEARLREQAALLDEARDAILVRDLDGRVVFWNRSAERLYGWKAEEATGRLVTDLVYKDLVAYRRALAAVTANDEWAGELTHMTRDGRRVIVEGRWTLVRGEGGEPRSILVINTDVTERKKLEAQYLRAQRMESIGTLAGGIAHDLNNVLAPILMSVDLLRLTIDDPSVAEVLSAVETSARRGADLVQQVLSFARGVDGPGWWSTRATWCET
jgi:PAS domain S-box-containing protein